MATPAGKHSPIVPVTAIAFTCEDEILLVGRGSWVSGYDVKSGQEVFSKGVLCLENGLTASIHGFAQGDGVHVCACVCLFF